MLRPRNEIGQRRCLFPVSAWLFDSRRPAWKENWTRQPIGLRIFSCSSRRKPGIVLKTEHLKTSADTALHCSTQHLTAIVRHSCLTARRTVRSIIGAASLPTHFKWQRFRMCRSHIHSHSQSRSRTAATATITLRMILRVGPLLGPSSIIPRLPEANATSKKEIGPRGRLFPRC